MLIIEMVVNNQLTVRIVPYTKVLPNTVIYEMHLGKTE